MRSPRFAVLCLLLALCSVSLSAHAQQPPSAPPHNIEDTWARVRSIANGTHLHVATDHGGATCFFLAADDATLTCGRRGGGSKRQHVFQRAEVKSVKLTRYGVSTAGGAGIGLGVGAAIGVAAVRPSGSGFDVGLGAARAAVTLIGAIGGAVVGGCTDMFRGPVVYRRLESE